MNMKQGHCESGVTRAVALVLTVSRYRNVILDERKTWHMTSITVSSDFRKTKYRRPNTNLQNLPTVIATKT